MNKVKRSPGNQFASHRTTHSKAGQSQAASRQPRYKIVSGRDRYTVINDLEPGTLYGFTVFPVDEEALRRHGGLDDVDNDEDVESASLLFAPVFAATRNDCEWSLFLELLDVDGKNDFIGFCNLIALVISTIILSNVTASLCLRHDHHCRYQHPNHHHHNRSPSSPSQQITS